jgi:hypothetical protein
LQVSFLSADLFSPWLCFINPSYLILLKHCPFILQWLLVSILFHLLVLQPGNALS